MAALFKNTEINRDQGRGIVEVLGKGIRAAGDLVNHAKSVMEPGAGFRAGSDNATAASAHLFDRFSAQFSAENTNSLSNS